MPYVEALKTFKGRLGHVNRGDKFNCDEGYFRALKKNGLAALPKPTGEEKTPANEPGPVNDRNIPRAPARAGKEGAGEDQGSPPAETSDPTRTDGQVLTSSSLRADLASRKKTLPVSVPGGRKGTPTPRKGKSAA